MTENPVLEDFETLDPKDWESARRLMHQMVDDAIDYIANVRERPIWQAMPPEVLASFKEPLPTEPQPSSTVYEAFRKQILPYPMGNIHPRFWAWYMGAGTLSGVLGDFWTSVMNPNVGGGNHAAHEVENQVLNWIKEIMGFPEAASGILVSGGSMANFTALAVARNVKSGYNIRQEGIRPEIAGKMRVYGSTEVHSCNQKATELLGLGAAGLVKIRVNSDYTIDLDELKKQIKRDRDAGLFPIAVIGSSGTVNTGAIDDLKALAAISKEEGLWFHVDGAIGAIAKLDHGMQIPLSGLEMADSIALDLHKWMHVPFEAGCVLIKNRQAHKDTFSLIPEYLAKNSRGLASGENWLSEYGLQLSRRFRALKVWMTIKEHGTRKLGRMIVRNIQQAQYLESQIRQHPHLELMAPVGLDIVCFRYNPGHLSPEKLDSLNKEIKLQLEERAIAMPGYTTLHGAYCLRIAISNHRTTLEDLDSFLDAVLSLGKSLS